MKWNKKKFAIKREQSLLVSAEREQIMQNSVGGDGRNHFVWMPAFLADFGEGMP